MEKMLLRTFQSQVALQCRFLLLAASDVHDAMKRGDTQRAFFALQNMLNAGANISKALWGSGGKLSAKRKPLRDSIGILDSSPLREVDLRNHFEHFDTRLDHWWQTSTAHKHLDLHIGRRDSVSNVDPIDRFRSFDPQTTELSFWGQDFNLQKLVDEVRTILPRAEREANKPPG